eukprot:jgi/Chlat1/2647/Chrsp178S02506
MASVSVASVSSAALPLRGGDEASCSFTPSLRTLRGGANRACRVQCTPAFRLQVVAGKQSKNKRKARNGAVIEAQEQSVNSEMPSPATSAREPGSQDFWEGDQWNWLGTASRYFVIGITLLTVGVGFVASRVYNYGAIDYKETLEYKQALQQDLDAQQAKATQ